MSSMQTMSRPELRCSALQRSQTSQAEARFAPARDRGPTVLLKLTAHSSGSVTSAPNQQRTVLKSNLWIASVSEIPSFHLLFTKVHRTPEDHFIHEHHLWWWAYLMLVTKTSMTANSLKEGSQVSKFTSSFKEMSAVASLLHFKGFCSYH